MLDSVWLPLDCGNSSKIRMLTVTGVRSMLATEDFVRQDLLIAALHKDLLVGSLAPGDLAGQWQDWATPVWPQSITSERK